MADLAQHRTRFIRTRFMPGRSNSWIRRHEHSRPGMAMVRSSTHLPDLLAKKSRSTVPVDRRRIAQCRAARIGGGSIARRACARRVRGGDQPADLGVQPFDLTLMLGCRKSGRFESSHKSANSDKTRGAAGPPGARYARRCPRHPRLLHLKLISVFRPAKRGGDSRIAAKENTSWGLIDSLFSPGKNEAGRTHCQRHKFRPAGPRLRAR